ncbi:hypothetical protein OKA04_23835 [Luteolibacter flavescens]|uniref:DUF1573 domain-containing protein n=1 Tax=Luteolibacter flavescens TaxID=1859460 RepID=A0ABT3FW45_9BACT|nr:hypothetical protein [Luteolibacter flavescens]MCW1887790.1 hypothetical protein [Luteolibacter flavescens]
MKSMFFAAVAAASLVSIAHGQEYQVRGLTLGQDVPGPEVHVHQDGGKADAGVLEVKSYLNHEGTTLKLKGPKIVLTTQSGAASVKDPAQVIGTCELPAKGGSVILLFIPEKPDSPASKIVVLDDSKKAFPPGSIKVANLSSLPVKIELEKKPFDFKAGEIANIENPPVGEGNSSGYKATCETATGWQAFGAGVWPHPGQKRVLQVVTNSPESKLVVIRGFRDVATPP